MISIDSSLFIQIINFVLLIGILNIVLYRPIRNILIQRREMIQGLEQSIDEYQKDSKEKDDAFARGIKEARLKGQKAKDALLQEAAEQERAMIDEINRKAQENLVKIQKKIEKEMKTVNASLLKEVDSFAQIIGQKILGRA
jgi:F-type H+-transporting ATPase subunit b